MAESCENFARQTASNVFFLTPLFMTLLTYLITSMILLMASVTSPWILLQ